MRLAPWLLLALMLVSAPGFAQATGGDRDAARSLATEGFHLYATGKHAEALERFRGAESQYHAPPHVLYIGRCLAKLGKVVEARDAYQQLLAEQLPGDAPEQFVEAKQSAKDEAPLVASRVARLSVEVDPPADGLRVSLDSRELSAAELAAAVDVDPGEHRVEVHADGFASQERVVSLSDGAAQTIAFSLEPSGDDAFTPSGGGSSLVAPVVLLGLGGVGIIVGAVTGGLALQKKGELDDACPSKVGCPRGSQELEEDGRTLGNVSTAGFVVGGVAAAAGVIWLVFALSGEDQQEAAVQPLIGPGQLGMRLRF
jgi:tetratricopeptide (TPR) repeat protein